MNRRKKSMKKKKRRNRTKIEVSGKISQDEET